MALPNQALNGLSRRPYRLYFTCSSPSTALCDRFIPETTNNVKSDSLLLSTGFCISCRVLASRIKDPSGLDQQLLSPNFFANFSCWSLWGSRARRLHSWQLLWGCPWHQRHLSGYKTGLAHELLWMSPCPRVDHGTGILTRQKEQLGKSDSLPKAAHSPEWTQGEHRDKRFS